MATLMSLCAADAQESDQIGNPVQFEEIVVTAANGELSRIRSSVSVSTLDPEQIQESVPSNAADILRNVPGLIVQASGGEGNANIFVRGLPESGGAKFTQFQEDGLPVLDFGDIDFGTADTFVRADYNIDRLEVIRGGPAATFASNAPGGVFNFISRTGDVAGGNIGLTSGLDFYQERLDADYGMPLDDQWRFHIGGFYRWGEGPRTVGYTAENGGQLKGNVTRIFEDGFVRLNFKLLDDRTPVFLPMPISITGSNSNPNIASLPGFDILSGAMQSQYFPADNAIDKNGNRLRTDLSDGYDSQSEVIGGEASFNLPGGWKLGDKIRAAATSGRFVGPYPTEVAPAGTLASQIGGAGATLRYATGPLAGQPITNPAALAGNGLAVEMLLFDVTLDNLDNGSNDFQLTKAIETEDFGTTHLTFGYFKSWQNIVEDWHWNTYLEEVKGQGAALLDVVNASGKPVTQQGLVAYGEPPFGNCCIRSYDLHYDTDAPYFALDWEYGPVNFDGSVRYDISRASGTYAANSGTTAFDVNGDGVIEPPETAVPIVNRAAALPVDYTKRYLSYSIGVNYLLNPDLALFARVSEGGRANAERLLFGGGILPNGDVATPVAVNRVQQVEGGVKWRSKNFSEFVTFFHTSTEDTNQDITSRLAANEFVNRTYDAKGIELESNFHIDRFSLSAGVTYTDSRIASDQITPGDVGNAIDPFFLYQFTAAYTAEDYAIGLNVIGQSHTPQGLLVAPGFAQVNAVASYQLTDALRFTLSANNLLNTIGLTEIPNGPSGVTANGLSTARSINGRTIMSSLKYSF